MRFTRLRIHAFGAIEDLDTGEAPLPRLVVVQGPNEAGKSTFFHFLGSILYGFYPASREANPFTPWSGGDASGEAGIVLDDGREVEVQRRLLSSPSGTLVRNGRSEELRNRTLPFAEHVPLPVFRQVFALTLSELAALEGESWARVQDRLATGMGATDLRPPREVAAELEDEAGRLWRPNQRGNQVVRSLTERARELTVRRRNAAEADRAVREADRELAEVRRKLTEARREREECRLYVERYRALLPIRDQLERIRGLEEEAGPPEALEDLPASPGARLDELGAAGERLEERLAEVEEGLDDARARASGYGPEASRVFEARDRVRALVGRVTGLEPVRVRIGQLDQEARDLDRRARALAGELLAEPLDRVDADAVGSFVPGRARRAVEELREAGDAVRRAEEEASRLPETGRYGALLPAGAAILAVGVVLAAWGVLGDRTALAGAGAFVTAVGAGLLGAGLAGRKRAPAGGGRPEDAPEARLAAARRRSERARNELEEALGGVPVLPDLLDRPPGDLAARLDRLRELLADRTDREARAAELREEVHAAGEDVRAAAEELGTAVPEDPAAAAHVLDEKLREAERARDVAEVAEREIERLERERERIAAELAEVREEERTLRSRLEEVGDGDETTGLERVRSRVQARERARQLREELRRGHPDLDEIRRRIEEAEKAGEEWAVDDGTLARKRAREEELVHTVEELSRRAEGLQKDIDHMSERDTVDAVEGELRTVRARIEERIRERDRLWVLASVVRQAERRFRENHQPDVLRRAGEYLEVVTDGRYRRVLVGEDRSDATFLLRGPGYPGPVEVDTPISTGTREQAYLALRLAILDHLDREGERLPLFLDEAFVNWDRERRDRTFRLLADVAAGRQVFFFTCHEEMARELAGGEARLITLAGPP